MPKPTPQPASPAPNEAPPDPAALPAGEPLEPTRGDWYALVLWAVVFVLLSVQAFADFILGLVRRAGS